LELGVLRRSLSYFMEEREREKTGRGLFVGICNHLVVVL
jgi:hypothetical protein